MARSACQGQSHPSESKSIAFKSDLDAIRSRHTSRWPERAARHSGVPPLLQFTQVSRLRRRVITILLGLRMNIGLRGDKKLANLKVAVFSTEAQRSIITDANQFEMHKPRETDFRNKNKI